MKKQKITGLLWMVLMFLFASCSDDKTTEVEESIAPGPVLETQKIVLNSEDYRHEFKGGGVSIGLFLGHHYRMNAAAQNEAIKLLSEDCNMQYFQDYIEIYPEDDPAYFDRRADYVKAAKVYQPDLKFSLVGNKFPKDLRREIIVNGETLNVLNTDDPEIYDRVANWYFKLFEGFYERGVPVEILNVVNEPDLDRPFRKHDYGLNGDTKEAVSRVFKFAVPKFKDMINDPLMNKLNMKMPLIMGPSTISPNGCIEYMQYFKANHPEVWSDIDIIATHQYINGANPELFKSIVALAEGKEFYQSETHALKGDGLSLNETYASRSLLAALSLSNLFSTAVNNGVTSWWYFENNYPDEVVHPGGLLSIPWAASYPTPYKHYYVYKSLTSAQPASSSVLGFSMESKLNTELIAFRKKGQSTVYAHYSNYNITANNIEISIKGINTSPKIVGYSLTRTSENENGSLVESKTFETPQDKVIIKAERLSFNSLELILKD